MAYLWDSHRSGTRTNEDHLFLCWKRRGNIGKPTFSTTANDQKAICKSLEGNKEMSSSQNGFVTNNICQINLIYFCDIAGDLMDRE